MIDTTARFKKRIGRAVKAHYRAAESYDFWDKLATAGSVFGGVLVIIVGIYAELLKAGLNKFGHLPGIVITGLGFGIFVLTTSQIIWKWSAKSESHRVAASKYAGQRRKLEMSIDQGRTEDLKSIGQELDTLGDQSPMVPGRIWRWADKAYKDKPN